MEVSQTYLTYYCQLGLIEQIKRGCVIAEKSHFLNIGIATIFKKGENEPFTFIYISTNLKYMNGGGSLEPPFLTDVPAQLLLRIYNKLIQIY